MEEEAKDVEDEQEGDALPVANNISGQGRVHVGNGAIPPDPDADVAAATHRRNRFAELMFKFATVFPHSTTLGVIKDMVAVLWRDEQAHGRLVSRDMVRLYCFDPLIRQWHSFDIKSTTQFFHLYHHIANKMKLDLFSFLVYHRGKPCGSPDTCRSLRIDELDYIYLVPRPPLRVFVAAQPQPQPQQQPQQPYPQQPQLQAEPQQPQQPQQPQPRRSQRLQNQQIRLAQDRRRRRRDHLGSN
jgi:hypothetical protein